MQRAVVLTCDGGCGRTNFVLTDVVGNARKEAEKQGWYFQKRLGNKDRRQYDYCGKCRVR